MPYDLKVAQAEAVVADIVEEIKKDELVTNAENL